MIERYLIGEDARLRANFFGEDGSTPIYATGVRITVLQPNSVSVVYQGADVQTDGAGSFYVDHLVEYAGRHSWRADCEGPTAAVAEGQFDGVRSRVLSIPAPEDIVAGQTWDAVTEMVERAEAAAEATEAVAALASARTILPSDYTTYADYLVAAAALGTGGVWADDPYPTTPASGTPELRRLPDRVFVGAAATESTGRSTQTEDEGTKLRRVLTANWLERDATLLSVSHFGGFGVVGATFTSDKPIATPGFPGTASIGVAGVATMDDTSSDPLRKGWALYGDLTRFANAPTSGFGMELGCKNLGLDSYSPTPYARLGWGPTGIWLAGGADSTMGGEQQAPNGAALMIGAGNQTNGVKGWTRGIVINADAIDGTDGVTGTGIAVALARGHVVAWFTNQNGAGANLYSTVDDINNRVSLAFDDNVIRFLGASGTNATVESVTNSTGYLRLIPAAVGGNVELRVGSTDGTAYNLLLTPAGAGNVRVGSGNLNVVAGNFQVGTTTVIDTDRTVRLRVHSKASLPTPVVGGTIYVSDDIGGGVPAFSDGTVWRRMTDRAVIA